MLLRAICISALLPAIAFLTPGCATSSPHTSSGISSSGQRELSDAWKTYEARQYHQVIPKLLQIAERYPQTPAANEARYLLGLSYEKIEGYKDAIDMFASYVRVEPQGQYAPDAKTAIQRLTRMYDEMFPSQDSLANDIDSLRKEIQGNPDSLSLQSRLANLLWKQGKYDEAGRLYAQLARKFPDFKTDSTFVERMELGSGDSYTVLSPAEIQRRDVARNPLQIINTTSFRAGRDRITRSPRFYVVTGQVVNRSDQTLYGVEVLTTVYGFGSTVFDTATYTIGLVNPGESRAFSIRLSNFEDMNNISRFECSATYQK